MADSIRIAGRHAADPSFSGTLPTPHPVRDFLTEEKRKQRIAYEVLLRNKADLDRQRRRDPMSVRPDRIETASRLVAEARAVDVYLGSVLAGLPAVKS